MENKISEIFTAFHAFSTVAMVFTEDFASSSAKRTKSETKQQVKEDKKNNSNCENKMPQHRYIFYRLCLFYSD